MACLVYECLSLFLLCVNCTVSQAKAKQSKARQRASNRVPRCKWDWNETMKTMKWKGTKRRALSEYMERKNISSDAHVWYSSAIAECSHKRTNEPTNDEKQIQRQKPLLILCVWAQSVRVSKPLNIICLNTNIHRSNTLGILWYSVYAYTSFLYVWYVMRLSCYKSPYRTNKPSAFLSYGLYWMFGKKILYGDIALCHFVWMNFVWTIFWRENV